MTLARVSVVVRVSKHCIHHFALPLRITGGPHLAGRSEVGEGAPVGRRVSSMAQDGCHGVHWCLRKGLSPHNVTVSVNDDDFLSLSLPVGTGFVFLVWPFQHHRYLPCVESTRAGVRATVHASFLDTRRSCVFRIFLETNVGPSEPW